MNTISYSFYRRLLALILSACLVVTIIPVTKVEAKVLSIPDNTLITFRVVDNQTIRVNENGKQEAIIINDDCVTVKNVNTGETIVSFKTDFSDEAIKYIQKNNKYIPKTKTTKISYKKIKQKVGTTGSVAAVAAAVIAILISMGVLTGGTTAVPALSLVSAVSGLVANVMDGSSKHGLKITSKSFISKDPTSYNKECWKVVSVKKY